MTHNQKPTEDLRVRRTRKLLMQALIDLIIEKGFSAITVQDIADRAMVHRATFYRHYVDKYDLLEQYMNEVYELTAAQEELASVQPHDAGAHNPLVGMVRMFEEVQKNADFYRAMLGAKGDLAFMQRIQQFSAMRLRNVLSNKRVQSKSPPFDVCLSYLSLAGVGVMVWWLKDGQAYTPEQIAAWINQLNKGVLNML